MLYDRREVLYGSFFEGATHEITNSIYGCRNLIFQIRGFIEREVPFTPVTLLFSPSLKLGNEGGTHAEKPRAEHPQRHVRPVLTAGSREKVRIFVEAKYAGEQITNRQKFGN